MQGLEGVKVLELGHMVAAAYATKLMADLGAEVIKVEEPPGDRARQRGPFPGGIVDPEKSGLFLSLNTNKRGITLDVRQDQDKLFHLVAWADPLIHNYLPAQMAELGINYSTFREINPRLVMCSITPFGLTGPHKDYTAYELTLAHGGGWAWLSPHTGIPWLLTHAPNGVRAPAPLLGQDTDQVMHDVLGYSDQEIARLKEERVLY